VPRVKSLTVVTFGLPRRALPDKGRANEGVTQILDIEIVARSSIVLSTDSLFYAQILSRNRGYSFVMNRPSRGTDPHVK